MKKITSFLLFITTLLSCYVVFAQQKKTNRSLPKEENKKDNLNKTDAKNRKQGLWFYKHDARMGEPMYYEYGNFQDDKKTGVWTKLDGEQRLMATENYYKGVLNGTSQYYENGRLTCVGNYRGIYTENKYDSVWVTDPVTYIDTLVAVPADIGYTKHGVWRYYDARTGQLTREEEYQVDNLIRKEEYNHYSKTDSTAIKRRNANLPHNKKSFAKPPSGKGSLIY